MKKLRPKGFKTYPKSIQIHTIMETKKSHQMEMLTSYKQVKQLYLGVLSLNMYDFSIQNLMHSFRPWLKCLLSTDLYILMGII